MSDQLVTPSELVALSELVARASWQASLLAAIVAIVVRCFGERLAARWRYLLWSVVLVRLLLVVAPASPWSLYQLAVWPIAIEPNAQEVALQTVAQGEHQANESRLTPLPHAAESPGENEPATGQVSPSVIPEPSQRQPAREQIDEERAATASILGSSTGFTQLSLSQGLGCLWFAGLLLFTAHLLWAYIALRHKLSRCQSVQDEDTVRLLDAARQKLGLKRRVELLVTAEPISPCVVGAWRPRLVVPELALTELDAAALEQVFCHELAHVKRGDLWMNWLMLIARCVHWFNPAAWWMVHEMQSLREMACDERTLTALDADQRQQYADTILRLVGLLASSPLAPGMVALFSSRARLSRRIEHIALGSFGSRLARVAACGLLVVLALVGWTDAGQIVAQEPSGEQASQPNAADQTPQASAKTDPTSTEGEPTTFELRGQTMTLHESNDGKKQYTPVAVGNVDVTLYRLRGMLGQPEKLAETKSDGEGRFSFPGLESARTYEHQNRLAYGLVLRAAGKPPRAYSFFDHDMRMPNGVMIDVTGKQASISGRVVNAEEMPIAGAMVRQFGIHNQAVPGVQTATTDQDGEFTISDLSVSERHDTADGFYFYVSHPDYPTTGVRVRELKTGVTLTIPAGGTLTGTVVEEATGKPAAHALVTTQNNEDVPNDAVTESDSEGRYRLVVAEGSYNIFAQTADQVTVQAVTNQEVESGQTIELPPLTLSVGGWIEGRVLNTKTGEGVVDYRDPQPLNSRDRLEFPSGPATQVALGLYGPAYPARRKVGAPMQLVRVDEQGRFRIRAAAGENYPYLVNTAGQRMMWDTQKQPPVVVKTGETTQYDMLITPKPTDDEKMKAANEVVAALPKELSPRAEAIIAEFRKLNHTVDETEVWCSLMRELVAIGPEAVPALCAELDATDEQRTMRRLAFALRAIGDPRSVPALIRAIPKTLQPPLSDYGLLVGDKELMKFMQQHDLASLSGKRRLRHFDLGRPVREVFGTIEKLTKQNFGEADLYSVVKSENPQAEQVQRRMYREQADKWQAWWEAHWREFTEDEAFSRVRLPKEPPYTPPPFVALGSKPKLGNGSRGAVLSPPTEKGAHFLDLDTGLAPDWPAEIPRSDQGAKHEDLALWAAQNGVDLMCVTYKVGNQNVYALRSFNMRLEEIQVRAAKNIDSYLKGGTLPSGTPVGELLLKLDDKTGRYTTGNAAFLYQTREGGLGIIELTDQITEARDITGQLFTPQGVGFHKGAKFNYHQIVPGK